MSKARYSSCVDTWMAEATDVSTDRALVTVDFGDFQGGWWVVGGGCQHAPHFFKCTHHTWWTPTHVVHWSAAGDLQKAKAGVASAYAVLYGLIFGGAGLAAYYTYVMSQ